MKRFFNWLKALFNRTMDKVEDPEMMLDQAKRDMQASVIQNRERAIQAITQRNELEKLLNQQRPTLPTSRSRQNSRSSRATATSPSS